jgi:hypothetical protein
MVIISEQFRTDAEWLLFQNSLGQMLNVIISEQFRTDAEWL